MGLLLRAYARIIFNGTIIILDQFNPSPLSHVQFLLRKQILQALMIRKNPTGTLYK